MCRSRRTSSTATPISCRAGSASGWPSPGRWSVEPELLICDEVTSALDVSVQAVIVELLRRLQSERHLAMIFITHNLALVRSIAQTVAVLSVGKVVEGPALWQTSSNARGIPTRSA